MALDPKTPEAPRSRRMLRCPRAGVPGKDREVLRQVRGQDGGAGALRAHHPDLRALRGGRRQHGVQQVRVVSGRMHGLQYNVFSQGLELQCSSSGPKPREM